MSLDRIRWWVPAYHDKARAYAFLGEPQNARHAFIKAMETLLVHEGGLSVLPIYLSIYLSIYLKDILFLTC